MKELKNSALLAVIAGGLVVSNTTSIAETTSASKWETEIAAASTGVEELQQEYTNITGESVELDEDVIAQEEVQQQQYQEEITQSLEALETISEQQSLFFSVKELSLAKIPGFA